MTSSMRRVPSARSLVSLMLAITAALGLLSAVLYSVNPPTVPFHSPTATHTGYFSVSYTGVYHYVTVQPLCSQSWPQCWVPSETVFYLTSENATVRLVFYCGQDFCSSAQQLPFHEGDRVYMKGTLLQPSEWPTSNYHPALQFIGDLYVFNYTAA